jgi:hypothetical protein
MLSALLLPLLLLLLLLCPAGAQQTGAAAAAAAARPPRNTVTLPAGAVASLTTAWSTRAAAAVRALAPRALNALNARLLARGVNVRTTERIIISPALRFFIASTSVPLPLSLAEIGAWVHTPAIPVSRALFFPLQVLFRTQYYLATDVLAGVAPPNTSVPIPAGVGQRGLRRLLGLAAPADDPAVVAALRDKLLARVVAEGATCVSDFELVEEAAVAAPAAPRRQLAQQTTSNTSAAAAAADPLSLLGAWDAKAAARLLAHLHGGTKPFFNASAAFGSLLALALQAQASVFNVQTVNVRVGVAVTAIDIPSVDASIFIRKGVEIDSAGADVFVRLAPTGGRRLQEDTAAVTQAAPMPQPPPPPPPPPSAESAEDDAAAAGVLEQSLLALSLPAGEPLPRNTSLLAADFVALLQAQAGAVGASLAPLAAQLGAGLITKSLNFLVTPVVSLILGQLTFTLPTTAAGLAAALEDPTLQALLSTTVDVTAAVILVFNVVFLAFPPPLVIPLVPAHTLGGRRRGLLSGSTAALSPDALLGAFRSFLASAGANVRVTELLASFQTLTYESVSFQIYTGALEREVLRSSATLNKTAHGITMDASLLVAPTAFSIFQVTFSANRGVTALLKRKPPV